MVCAFWHGFYFPKQMYNYHQLFYQSILPHLLFIIILYICFDFVSSTDQDSSCKKSLGMFNQLFLISPRKILFTNDPNLHQVSFLQANPAEIHLHNFIIVMPCFFEIYKTKYKLDTKFLNKLKNLYQVSFLQTNLLKIDLQASLPPKSHLLII